MVLALLCRYGYFVSGMVTVKEKAEAGEALDILSGELICIDKPLEWTSFDAVKRLRNILLRKMKLKKVKVGHAGTLDPLATGVMIIATGKNTRLIEQLQAGEKEYVAEVKFGSTTPSFDLETEVDAQYPSAHIDAGAITGILPAFRGDIMQVPPVFSACKVNGRRAYATARKGGTVELQPKAINIRELELVDFDSAEKVATFRVVCSKGTYIRALARDLGVALNSGAHLTALRRTRVGEISIDNCMTIEQTVALLQDADIIIPDNNQINQKQEKI